MDQSQPPTNHQPFESSAPPQQYGGVPPMQQPTMPVTDPKALLPHHSSRIPLVLAILFGVLLLFAIGFGVWAYMERNDYKYNSDLKSEEAVEAALVVQKDELSQEFAEEEKNPYVTFNGPDTYGSVSFDYPKTWSVYTLSSDSSRDLLTVYMHPRELTDVDDKENIQAFILEIRGSSYDTEVDEYENKIERGEVTAVAFRADLVPDVLGLRVTGQFEDNINGTTVYLPIRDRTLVLTTESNDYLPDFERILKTLKFTP